MFAKKFLTGSILSLSLIFGLQNVVCADKLKVKVRNNYIELLEGNHTIFIQSIPDYYSYKYHVNQLNNMEIEDEEAIDIIHQATERATMANFSYYGIMDPGADLSNAGSIYAEHDNSLENLLMCLNRYITK